MSETLDKLLKAVDTACWCWAVQKNSKRKGQIDWKSALDDLCCAWGDYQIKTSEAVAVIPDEVCNND